MTLDPTTTVKQHPMEHAGSGPRSVRFLVVDASHGREDEQAATWNGRRFVGSGLLPVPLDLVTDHEEARGAARLLQTLLRDVVPATGRFPHGVARPLDSLLSPARSRTCFHHWLANRRAKAWPAARHHGLPSFVGTASGIGSRDGSPGSVAAGSPVIPGRGPSLRVSATV